ncbi:MAG TPA: TonB-dependent receptor [Gammaproteobacteria bacterium]
MKNGRAIHAVASAAIACAAADVADAQQSPDGSLEEIVVTAQFRAQNLQDTPLAITAVGDEALRARSQRTILDVSAQAPSVIMQPAPQGYGNSAQIAIRGIGQDDYNLALEPGVGLYLDDVYYSTLFGAVLDLLDLERVEILRGPQGTLFGRNSIGGAVRLVSRPPTGDGDSYVEATYGTDERLDLRAAGELTLVEDKLFARVSGSSKHQDGYMYRRDYKCVNPSSPLPSATAEADCLLGTEGGTDSTAGRVALRWLASDAVEVNVVADVYRAEDEPQANKLLRAGVDPTVSWGGETYGPQFLTDDRFTNYSTYSAPQLGLSFEPRNSIDAYGMAVTIDWSISDDLSLKSITAYRDTRGEFSTDNDGSPLMASVTAPSMWQEQTSQELRFTHSPSDRFDYTAGLYYFDADGGLGGRLIAIGGLLDFVHDDTILSSNSSAFLHTTTHLTDTVNLTVGLRYTEEEKTYTFHRINPNGGPVFLIESINGATVLYDEDRFDYRVAIDRRWSDEILTYAQYSTGFRGGGVSPRPFYDNQLVPLYQEELDTFELGVKLDLADRRVRLNVALFRNDYQDIQVETSTPFFNPNLPVQPDPSLPFYNPVEGTFPSGVMLNAGNAESTGLEVETLLRFGNLSLDVSASWQDFEYESLSPAALGSGFSLDMITPFTPERKYSLGAQYDFPLASGASIMLRLDANHQSEIYSEPVNADYNRIDSRTVYNTRVAFLSADDAWETSFAVINLTDEEYFHSIFGRTATGASGMPNRGREWALSVRRRF